VAEDLQQGLEDIAFAQIAVKKNLTNWEYHASSKNVPAVARL
jgi:hypothetical protein